MNKTEKKEAALSLADSARLEHLRRIPKKRRAADEEREFQRLYQRSRRRDQRGEESPYDKFETAQEFWAANRLLLPKKKLEEYLAQQERVLDQEWWMQHGFEADPNDENEFVGLEEGLRDLDAFTAHGCVFAGGTIHDDPLGYKQHPVLRDVNWAVRDIGDFFKEAEIFDELLKENAATEVYVRYGIRLALSAYNIRTFKQRIAEHERGKLQPDVRRAHVELESDRCWSCGLEAKQRDAQGPSPQA